MTQSDGFTRFSELSLPDPLQRAVQAVGYETPTPIQQRTIPPLIEGAICWGMPLQALAKPPPLPCPFLQEWI